MTFRIKKLKLFSGVQSSDITYETCCLTERVSLRECTRRALALCRYIFFTISCCPPGTVKYQHQVNFPLKTLSRNIQLLSRWLHFVTTLFHYTLCLLFKQCAKEFTFISYSVRDGLKYAGKYSIKYEKPLHAALELRLYLWIKYLHVIFACFILTYSIS